MAEVPRVKDITGKSSKEEAANRREWERNRALFQQDKQRYGHKTKASKEAWRRRIEKTRSK